MSELKTNKISTNDQNNVAIDNALGLKSYTTTQRDALPSPQAGDTVYNSTTGTIDFYNGSGWFATSGSTYSFDVEYLEAYTNKICKDLGLEYKQNLGKQEHFAEVLGRGSKPVGQCFSPLFFPLFTSVGKILWCCEHRGSDSEKEYTVGNWIKDGLDRQNPLRS